MERLVLNRVVRRAGPAFDAVRRLALVLEARESGKRLVEQMLDGADDPVLVVAEQSRVGAHRHLGAPLRPGHSDAERRPLHAQQIARDLGDHVPVLVGHPADGRDLHRPLSHHPLGRDGLVRVPLGGHAIVAKLRQNVPRLFIARELLEHPEVEGRRAVQQGARIRVDAECRRGASLGPDVVPDAKGETDRRHESGGRPHGQSDEGMPDRAHTLLLALPLDLFEARVVIGHEEEVALGDDARGVAGPKRRRGVDHAGETVFDAAIVWMKELDPADLRHLHVLRMPQRPGQDVDILGAQLAQDRLEHDGAAEGVRVPGPLRVDVRAAVADQRGRALEPGVRGIGETQKLEVVAGETLSKRSPELGDDAGDPGQSSRMDKRLLRGRLRSKRRLAVTASRDLSVQ